MYLLNFNKLNVLLYLCLSSQYDSSKSQGHGHSHSTHMKRSESYRGSSAQQSSSKANSPMMQGISPHDILVKKGSSEAVRKLDVMQSLLDFFGM